MFYSLAYAESISNGHANASGGAFNEFFLKVLSQLPFWIASITIFLLSFVIAGILKRLVINHVVKRSQYEVQKEVLLLVGRAVYFGVLIFGIVIAFQILNINLWALIGAMGIGLGFAFKDILSNFIAGVIILTQKRFVIGDLVKIDDNFGIVEDIDVRVSVIKTYENTSLIIPNSQMLMATVHNLTSGDHRRLKVDIPVHYDTDLRRAIEYFKAAIETHPEILKTPPVQVIVWSFADSAINLEGRYWISSHDNWPRIHSEVMTIVQEAFDKGGFIMPYNTTTLNVDSQDELTVKALRLE